MNRIIPGEYILAKEPKKQKLLNEFGLAQKSVFANLYILTKSADTNALSDTIHKTLNESSVNGSASVLPRADGVFARMIGSTAGEVKDAVDIILNKIRTEILKKPFTGARKY